VESIHEGRTAQATTTRTESAAHSGAIPDSERSHFDAPPKTAPEVALKRSVVDPLLSREIDDSLPSGQRQTDLDGMKLEFELSCPPSQELFDFALEMSGVEVAPLIFGGCPPHNPAVLTPRELE
jgi:hypothetical protein